jgi:DNA-binding beta-propeller fold protein YncE
MLINISPGGGGGTTGLTFQETINSNATSVAVDATSTTVITANSKRTCLYVINIGINWVTLNHKTPITFGQGIVLSPYGGAYIIENNNLDKRSLYGICDAGQSTLLSVYEGLSE